MAAAALGAAGGAFTLGFLRATTAPCPAAASCLGRIYAWPAPQQRRQPHRLPGTGAASLPPTIGALTPARRAFGINKDLDRLRLKGVVRRAYKQSQTPRLQKKATDHYLHTLKAQGNAGAIRAILSAERRRTRKGGQLVPADGKAAVPARVGKGTDTGALTSEEKTRLLWRYMPDESEVASELRKSSHKWMWRWMKNGDWRRFDVCVDQLKSRQVVFDEVTYNLSMFGTLLHPRMDDSGARELFDRMAEERRFHPSLLRLQGDFLESYFELKEVDAAPNSFDLRKVARTFWDISVNFKRQRVKDTRRGLAEEAAKQRARLAADENGDPGPVALPEYVYDGCDDMDEGRGLPRVKFPARRPRQMQGVHKGSGVPNQRKHRWKH